MKSKRIYTGAEYIVVHQEACRHLHRTLQTIKSYGIKAGVSLDVEVAYELNDTTTDIEVEVKELISFDDDLVTKTFSIAQ